MKKLMWSLLLLCGMGAGAQKDQNTLLWRISGNGLQAPSYVFGTIHMICADGIQLSDSLQNAINKADAVYLELDMDNMMEMLGAMRKMKMRGDTTLENLLPQKDYLAVKAFFTQKGSPIPFSMLETFKPMLAAATLMESSVSCDNSVAMEQLVMKEAKKSRKNIKGLETMAYQLSIFDSIPYKLQAEQLAAYVAHQDSGASAKDDFAKMENAYKSQDLKKLEQLTLEDDMGISRFTDLLLYNRNNNWVTKMQGIMSGGSMVFAVGAGHLPGEKGVLNLLKKKGYKVEPVANKMDKKITAEL
jgi:uncharacterized protein YbaP (TraB family)